MKRVLLVEDNVDNRDLVCAFLEGLFLVESCTDAHEALALLQAGVDALPDLLLLDISLPGMDGVELLHRIKADPKLARIPAIALTAHAMKDDESRFRSSGFDDYISKPIVDETLLIESIQRLILSERA